jgi:D-3-phosphoglycerate dehydrogenase
MNEPNTKNVLVLGQIHHAGLDLLGGRDGVSVETFDQTDPAIPEKFKTADGVIVRTLRIDDKLIEGAPRLQVVARHGVGYDNVDVAALTGKGIPLTTVGDANALTVAEQTLFLMLALAKHGARYDQSTRAGDWQRREAFDNSELWRKTVLVVGFGRIGSRVARLCQAFGMQVLVVDPYVPAYRVEAEGHRRADSLHAALAKADYVTLHLPLSAESRQLIGAAELKAMKNSAVLINTSRGPAIDELALVSALESGGIRAAGLDVFHDEPPAKDNPLFALDNVLLSPHIAGITAECAARMSLVCAQNVLDAFDRRLKPDHVVNREVLGR